MKKILLIAVMGLSFLNASELTKEDLKRMDKLYSMEKKDTFSSLKKEFEETTGDYNFDKYYKEAVKDSDWKKANFYIREKSEEKKVTYNRELINLQTPEYEKALEYYAKSTNKGNIIAAYQGFALIEKVFMYIEKNPMQKTYLNTFSDALMNKNYCVGYLYKAKSERSRGSSKNNAENYELMKKGLNECLNKDKIPQYYINGIKHQIVFFKTMDKVIKHKEEQANKMPTEKVKGEIK